MIPLTLVLESVVDSVDAKRLAGAEKSVAPLALSVAALAPRIRTGCLYELQPAGTFGLLVTRQAPRRLQRVRVAMRAHWPWFAPSFLLLTGHAGPCPHRRCRRDDGSAAGHRCNVPAPRQQLGWEGYAAAYRAELDRWPRVAHLAVVRQIALWLQTFETVTLLSFEPSMPRGVALATWRERGEFIPYAQRHVLRDWLLTGPSESSNPRAVIIEEPMQNRGVNPSDHLGTPDIRRLISPCLACERSGRR